MCILSNGVLNSDSSDSNRATEFVLDEETIEINSLTPTMTLSPIKLIAGKIPLHGDE